MKLRLTPRAHQDQLNIASFIERENPVAARMVINRIEETMRLIEKMPGVGRRSGRLGTFEFVVKGLPFLIIYRILNDVIEVLTIFHTSRDPKKK